MISALLGTALLGFVGLIVDAGQLYAERRQVQNGADEAALAGAFELTYGGSVADAAAASLENAAANGFDNDGTTNTVTVNIPPASGEFNGQSNHVQVIINADPTTFFIHVLPGVSSGVAANGAAGYAVVANELPALFISNDDCGIPDPFVMSGSHVVVNGEIHSNSEADIPGSDNDFNGQLTYGSCGLDVGGGGNTFIPPPTSGPPEPPPLTHSYGDFPCTMTFTSDTDLSSVPAAWVGADPSSGQLLSGVYCSTANLQLSGSDVTGTVTLVAQGELVVAAADWNLTPYWRDVLLFSQASAPLGIDLSGSGGNWEGIIMAPNGLVEVQGSGGFSLSSFITASRLHISGSDFSLTAMNYGYGQGWSGGVRLVE